ncbi:hypothetical protein, partial [Heyndrickxia faecalis]|uniref:hypothetical protein n=1 Tax=Heyndrickxia faecalis TaxID=2824910 RepID=UPI003D1B3223
IYSSELATIVMQLTKKRMVKIPICCKTTSKRAITIAPLTNFKERVLTSPLFTGFIGLKDISS